MRVWREGKRERERSKKIVMTPIRRRCGFEKKIVFSFIFCISQRQMFSAKVVTLSYNSYNFAEMLLLLLLLSAVFFFKVIVDVAAVINIACLIKKLHSHTQMNFICYLQEKESERVYTKHVV